MDKVNSPISCTYAALWHFHVERLSTAQKSEQEFRNHSSALNFFIGIVGKTRSSYCYTDFSDKFECHLTRLAELLSAKGLASSSIANKISYIRSIRDSYYVLMSSILLTGSFRESLLSLMQSRNLTQVELAKEIGVSKQLINSWVSQGKLPKAISKTTINRIERFFNLSENSLLGKVDLCTTTYGEDDNAYPALASRIKRYELSKDHYWYKDVNAFIKNEWLELLDFYTRPFLLNGLQRNASWRVKDASMVTTACGWESITPTGYCVTASIRWKYVSSFFGYLIRPKDIGGKGMPESQLSIALLTNAMLMEDFIDFKRKRSGLYTGEIEKILIFWSSLLRSETGFLWQQPKYGERLIPPVPKESWQKWCDENNDILHKMKNGLRKGGHIKKGRNPQEPIEAILADPNPIQALIRMTERMEQQLTLECRSILMAIRKRNLLLVKMLISNPLRIHHYSLMSYRKDNKGNLYQDASGAWRLRFQPEDFKNQKGAAHSEYDVPVSIWLFNDLNEYLSFHRQYLANAEISDRVFLPSKQHGRGHNKLYWEPNKISGCIREITRLFIPDCPGFGAHAFRHIIATDYIRNNPNGFQIVANILHDKLETVMREYAHLKVADGFSHWSSYLQDQITQAGGEGNE